MADPRPAPYRYSPSAIGSFTSCPLAFRFAYVDRLPEPSSPAACKGTLVHRALQYLHGRPPADRTLEHALADLDRAELDLAGDPEFASLDLDDEARAEFRADARDLVRKSFELEDPAAVRSIGLELKLEADLDGVRVRGIIDRLELDEDGELVVSDYKTGRAPSERSEQRSLAGVHIYAALCERVFGRRPTRIQLLYLSTPEVIVATPSEQSTRGVVVRSRAVRDAVAKACARDDFRPRTGPLCAWCGFREFCPAFGGDPDQAAPVLAARAAAAAGRPMLPLGA